ncbi:MAG: hypothetical protein DMG13_31850 [Acidobacteria bacterium]|nr:MAG: hypothetical protein DMG13_31850 [Acidobacteriota bacterium]
MAYIVISPRIEEHREALLNLWKENFRSGEMRKLAKERFAWLYQATPVDPARTWLAMETGSNAVIGCGSVFPLNTYVEGRVVRTGIAVDFAVDIKHRIAGVALAIQQALISGSCAAGFDLLMAKPNQKAFPIFKRAGYQMIGETHEWLKPIDDDEFQLVDFTDEFVGSPDERFDQLWDAGRPQYQNVGEKTAAYLNWRYSTFKQRNYRYYCLLRRGDRRLAGYVVFNASTESIYIADLLCEHPESPVLETLLLGLASRMRMEGKKWIRLWYLGGHLVESRIRSIGFAQGNSELQVVARAGPRLPVDVRNGVFEKNNWFLFSGEMDLC